MQNVQRRHVKCAVLGRLQERVWESLSYPNEPCINGKLIYSAFRWCINIHLKKCTLMTVFFFWSRVTYVYKIWPFLIETTELLSFSILHFVSSFKLLFWALKVKVKIILMSMQLMCILTAYQNASLPVTSQICSCTLTPGSTSRMWFLKSAPMVVYFLWIQAIYVSIQHAWLAHITITDHDDFKTVQAHCSRTPKDLTREPMRTYWIIIYIQMYTFQLHTELNTQIFEFYI